MKNRKLFLVALALGVPLLLVAGGHAEGASQYAKVAGRETDFIPRLFNFLIFVGLLYYLIAEPVKNFFKGRQEEIAGKLQDIEKRLQEAKEARKSAEQTLAESKRKAEEIIKDAKSSAELLTKQYQELGEKEIEALIRQYQEKMEFEERKMQRDTIVKLLDENIRLEDIPLDNHQVIDILDKKVA